MLMRFVRDERGATAIEYGLIAALLSVAILGAVGALGGALNDNYSETAARVAATIP
jgi:pilus assembly protein Flp/PilA